MDLRQFGLVLLVGLLTVSHAYIMLFINIRGEHLLEIDGLEYPEDHQPFIRGPGPKKWSEAFRTMVLVATGDMGWFDAFNAHLSGDELVRSCA